MLIRITVYFPPDSDYNTAIQICRGGMKRGLKSYSDKLSYFYLAIVLLLLGTLGMLYLEHEKRYQVDTYLKEQVDFQTITWKSASYLYRHGMKMYFDLFVMKNERVLEILKAAKTATPEEKVKLRHELYDILSPPMMNLRAKT